ncbi:MAG: hypothetical protein ACREF9_11995, partial [Opitutaceae bacterium]
MKAPADGAAFCRQPSRADFVWNSPGACYHVINRGNYRRDIFAAANAARAFETCLGEAAVRCRWRV